MAVLAIAQAKKAAAAVSSNLKLDKVKEGVAGFAPKVCLLFTPLVPETLKTAGLQ